MRSLIVVGGGIAGLAAAYFAHRRARAAGEQIKITLLERDQYLGGKILTERVDGFVLEAGPDTFLATKPWGVSLCRELGISGRLQGTNQQYKNTYVLLDGHLHTLPEGLTMMIPTRIAPMVKTSLLSWTAKARMALDFFLPPNHQAGEESLGQFISRRLGRPAYERLIEPLLSGIYAGDGDALSLQATFPYLRDLELNHGGLIKGALAMRRKMALAGNRNGNPPRLTTRSVFLTPRSGLAEIVERLSEELQAHGVRLHTGVAATRIEVQIDRQESYLVEVAGGDRLAAGGLILATPSFASARLLAEVDPGLVKELQAIPYVSTATISLAYQEKDLPRKLDGYGYVIPRREGRKALACTWTSTKFPHRAPPGYALLRVFAGRAGLEADLPWDESGLLRLAKDELRQTLGITAQPVLERVFIWEQAMPQYNLGHPSRLARIGEHLNRLPGLALAGNAYRGIGIPDCIHSGQLAAEKVLDEMGITAPA